MWTYFYCFKYTQTQQQAALTFEIIHAGFASCMLQERLSFWHNVTQKGLCVAPFALLVHPKCPNGKFKCRTDVTFWPRSLRNECMSLHRKQRFNTVGVAFCVNSHPQMMHGSVCFSISGDGSVSYIKTTFSSRVSEPKLIEHWEQLTETCVVDTQRVHWEMFHQSTMKLSVPSPQSM